MGKSLGSLISSFFDFLRSLFGGGTSPSPTPTPTPIPTPPVDNTTEPIQILSPKVLLIIYDPVMEPATGKELSETMNWNQVDALITGFISDIQSTSGGNVRYQVVQRVELNEFPAKVDGFRYTPATYLDVIHGGSKHMPEGVDYHAILTGFNILPRVAAGTIDEVWLFGFPHAGFYESIMGGAGAFWCNSNPLSGTSGCVRKFVVMGFSYERGVGEMLESYGHRCESILSQTFTKTSGEANFYERFIRHEKSNPGNAEVGDIHFAPNSAADYDWNNPRMVASNCYDWYNYPKFLGDIRQVNADEWGNGDIRKHHTWWLKHLPKVAGITNGIANNWWHYIADPNKVGK